MTSDIIVQGPHQQRGKIRYATTIRWQRRGLGDEFSRRVIELVRRTHPGALNAGSGQ